MDTDMAQKLTGRKEYGKAGQDIGKDFDSILFGNILTDISGIINTLNGELLSTNDENW